MKLKLLYLLNLLWPFLIGFACFGITVWGFKGGAEILGYVFALLAFIVGMVFTILGLIVLTGEAFIKGY